MDHISPSTVELWDNFSVALCLPHFLIDIFIFIFFIFILIFKHWWWSLKGFETTVCVFNTLQFALFYNVVFLIYYNDTKHNPSLFLCVTFTVHLHGLSKVCQYITVYGEKNRFQCILWYFTALNIFKFEVNYKALIVENDVHTYYTKLHKRKTLYKRINQKYCLWTIIGESMFTVVDAFLNLLYFLACCLVYMNSIDPIKSYPKDIEYTFRFIVGNFWSEIFYHAMRLTELTF